MEFFQNLHDYISAGTPALAYGAAFLGGLAASVTPCVYPMIPITVAYIGGRSAGSRGRAFLLSTAYVLGIALTYSALGAAAGLTHQTFGRVANHPATLAVLGAVFVGMGLSMMDVFALPLPSWLTGLGARQAKGGGYVGAFLVGLFAGLAVGPCTAPVLMVILTYVAAHQAQHNVLFGATLLLAYSLGMGILFLVVGTSAGTLMSLPKPGKWMVTAKKIFGGIIVAFGGYYMYMFAFKLLHWGGTAH